MLYFYFIDPPNVVSTPLPPLENQVYIYDDSESPREPTARADPGRRNTVSVLNEAQPSRSSDKQDELKLSRCLSDPGPKEKDGGDGPPHS